MQPSLMHMYVRAHTYYHRFEEGQETKLAEQKVKAKRERRARGRTMGQLHLQSLAKLEEMKQMIKDTVLLVI